jgi:hypothetical protein
MIREWALIPLAVSGLCFLWVWLANRRPRMSGVSWPKGFELSGRLKQPDLFYPADVVLGAEGRFGIIQCRSLTIAKGAEVVAEKVVCTRLRVDGVLRGVEELTSAKRLDVRGELKADRLRCPKVRLFAASRTTVLTVTGPARIERHPKAVVKGFFDDPSEMQGSHEMTAVPDTTDKITVVR